MNYSISFVNRKIHIFNNNEIDQSKYLNNIISNKNNNYGDNKNGNSL